MALVVRLKQKRSEESTTLKDNVSGVNQNYLIDICIIITFGHEFNM